MKTHPAIGAIDFSEIPVGMHATDAMLKRSPIAFVRSGSVTHGRYLTLIGGTTASVEEAMAEGLRWGAAAVLDHVLLADVHPGVFEAILGVRRPSGSGSLAVLETDTACAAIRAAEAALKGTPVELVELRLADAGLSGKGLAILRGILHDLEAATALAMAVVAHGDSRLRVRVIAAPHDATLRQLGHGSAFGLAELIALDGEGD
ncbi:MAG: BMC domain-containing protein [Acidobacteriota bacterium]